MELITTAQSACTGAQATVDCARHRDSRDATYGKSVTVTVFMVKQRKHACVTAATSGRRAGRSHAGQPAGAGAAAAAASGGGGEVKTRGMAVQELRRTLAVAGGAGGIRAIGESAVVWALEEEQQRASASPCPKRELEREPERARARARERGTQSTALFCVLDVVGIGLEDNDALQQCRHRQVLVGG